MLPLEPLLNSFCQFSQTHWNLVSKHATGVQQVRECYPHFWYQLKSFCSVRWTIKDTCREQSALDQKTYTVFVVLHCSQSTTKTRQYWSTRRLNDFIHFCLQRVRLHSAEPVLFTVTSWTVQVYEPESHLKGRRTPLTCERESFLAPWEHHTARGGRRDASWFFLSETYMACLTF